MLPRRVFIVLTTLLAVGFIAATVLLAFYALLDALGDAVAASVVQWIALGCLLLLVIDLLLLVGALGINAMQRDDDIERQ